MRVPQAPHVALLTIALFFGLLVWIDSPSAYTQSDPTDLYQLTNQHVEPASSRPYGFTEFNGAVYFGLYSEKGGLWKTDGTEPGTVLVKDIDISPSSLRRSGDLLYFSVYNELNATLWKSDGTSAGTVPLKTFRYVDPYSFASVGDVMYFTAADQTHGSELWRTDGTPEGTRLVADVRPGPDSADPREMVVVAGTLYFTGEDAEGVGRLWQSEGTSEGTQTVPGTPEQVYSLRVMQDVLYFVGYDESHGSELWRYNPNAQDPTLVRDIFPGSESAQLSRLIVVNDQLLFVAQDDAHGRELWRSDGTTAGTQLVKDIAPGMGDAYISELAAVDTLLYFVADVPGPGNGLWKSDGTTAGTTIVADGGSDADGFYPRALTAMDGQLYFLAPNAQSQSILWKSDGTPAGTVPVTELMIEEYLPGGPFTAIDGRLYFSAADDEHGYELWISDGTAEGTAFVKNLDTNQVGPYFDAFTRVKERLYFTTWVYDALSGEDVRLWLSDGTTASTVPVSEQTALYQMRGADGILFISGIDETGPALWKHGGTSAAPTVVQRFAEQPPSDLIVLGNQLLFNASDETTGDDISVDDPIYDLWRSDGTTAGTFILVKGSPTDARLWLQTVFNGHVVATRGNEIWLLDGTPEGTTHFTPEGIQGTIYSMVTTPHVLYFTADQLLDNFELVQTLWRSDGTPEGTFQLVSEEPIDYFTNLTTVSDALFFTAAGDENISNLWYNDGTSQDIVRLTDLLPQPGYYQSLFADVNGQLFFTIDDGVHGPELWRSDGTPEGTSLVKDVAPTELLDVPSAYPGPLFAFGDRLFFGAHDGVHGHELWRSDGTTDGTVLFKDINPGAPSSSPQHFIGREDRFYFSANDGVHGRELWQSDGTPAGTTLVTDLYGGSAGADPNNRILFDDTLYFTADNGLDGRQLFGLDLPAVPLALPVADEPPPPNQYQHHLYLPLVDR